MMATAISMAVMQSGNPGQQAEDEKHAAEEFSKRREIAQPDRQMQAGDHVAEGVERA